MAAVLHSIKNGQEVKDSSPFFAAKYYYPRTLVSAFLRAYT